MILRAFRILILTATCGATNAQAQIQTQPVEIITAAPPAVFSERSGYWPTDEYAQDVLLTDRSTINERLNSVPGVQARESGSPTVSIRGSAQADRVLKLVDGAALNMADGVGASDLLIPTEVMSQVSILKGPSSVFYGRSAMAGVIDHRVRYFDRLALKGTLTDNSSQFGTRNIGVILPFTNKSETTKLQGSLFHENNPGDYKFQSTTTDAKGRRTSSSTELTRATLAGDMQSGAWHFATRLVAGKTVGESPGSLAFPFRSTFDTDGTLATVEASRPLGGSQHLAIRVTDTRLNGLYDKETVNESTSDVSRTSINLDHRALITDQLLVRSFADAANNELSASYLANRKYREHDFDLGQSYEYSISPEISIQPGFRYLSRFGEVFKALGVIRSRERHTQFITYGEGFRAPSLTDRLANYSTFEGNPDLKPERAWAIEAGASFQEGQRYGGFLDGFATRASVYYNEYRDIVDNQINGAVITKVNSGRARTIGSEASVAYGYEAWSLSVGYNYLDGKNKTANEPLRLNPQHQGVVTLSHLFGPLVFEARETFWSSFYDRDPATGALAKLPAWETFDLTVRTLGFTDWEFRGGVLNLFDENRELTIGYPEPQRRFFVSALRYF